MIHDQWIEPQQTQTLSVPIPEGSDDAPFLAAVQKCINKVSEFAPDAIFISCGFDALKEDDSSTLQCTPDGYGQAMLLIVQAFPALPIVSVLEG